MELNLHKKQMFVLKTLMNGDANEILWGGAAGGGKSYMLRAIAIIFAMEVPRCNVYLFRRTVKDLIATHMRGPASFPVLLNEFVQDGLVKVNHSSSTIEFENGSIISLNHIQYEADLEKYLSAEMHVVLFDESTTFTPKMIQFIRSRLRLGSLEIPDKYKKALPFALYATNPRGPSHLYFKSNFVDVDTPCVPFEAPEDEGGMKRMFIPALLSDNPTLMRNDPDYIKRVMGMGDPEVVKAYINGDWSCAEGAALPTFSRENHVIPAKTGRSVHWPVYCAYDYGFSAPYSVLFFCIADGESSTDFCPPKGSIIVVGEIYGDDGKEHGLREEVGTTAMKIKRFHQFQYGGTLLSGPADTAIFSREQGPSIADSMSKASNRYVEFVPADKTPGSRINGLAVIRRLLENVLQNPHELAGLYVLDNCPRLITHMSALSLDEKNPEDVDTTQPDHDWDTLRYIGLFKSSIASKVALEGV